MFFVTTQDTKLKRLLEVANGVVKVGFEREGGGVGWGLTRYELMADEIDSI